MRKAKGPKNKKKKNIVCHLMTMSLRGLVKTRKELAEKLKKFIQYFIEFYENLKASPNLSW